MTPKRANIKIDRSQCLLDGARSDTQHARSCASDRRTRSIQSARRRSPWISLLYDFDLLLASRSFHLSSSCSTLVTSGRRETSSENGGHHRNLPSLPSRLSSLVSFNVLSQVQNAGSSQCAQLARLVLTASRDVQGMGSHGCRSGQCSFHLSSHAAQGKKLEVVPYEYEPKKWTVRSVLPLL